MNDQSAHVSLECWVLLQTVGQSVLFTKTVQHILHVSVTSVVTLALVPVASMQGVLFTIISQCVHVILVSREIHFLAAIQFKVG